MKSDIASFFDLLCSFIQARTSVGHNMEEKERVKTVKIAGCVLYATGHYQNRHYSRVYGPSDQMKPKHPSIEPVWDLA